MLGYATGPADLTIGDALCGVLATGDIAECDSDGFYRLTGRLTRFAKLYGKRVNLASLESEIEQVFGVRAAVIEAGSYIKIFIEGDTETASVRAHIASLIGVPPSDDKN